MSLRGNSENMVGVEQLWVQVVKFRLTNYRSVHPCIILMGEHMLPDQMGLYLLRIGNETVQ